MQYSETKYYSFCYNCNGKWETTGRFTSLHAAQRALQPHIESFNGISMQISLRIDVARKTIEDATAK